MKKMLAAALLAGLATAPLRADEPRFRLAASTLQLPPGDTSGKVTVTILAAFEESDEHPKGVATLVDVTPNATAVTIKSGAVNTGDEARQVWSFPVQIDNLPKAASQSRTFLLSYGAFREKLDYTLTNVNAVTFGWSVKAPAEWNLATQPTFPIALRVGDVPATNIQLNAAFVSDDKSKETIGGEHFKLCAGLTTGCDAVPASLSPRTPYTLYVMPSGPPPIGVFKGTISLAATERTDPETLTLTLYSRRPGGRRWGVAALVAGVGLSLLIQVFIPNLLQLNQEKAAINVLRGRLASIVEEYRALPADIRRAAANWEGRATTLGRDMGVLDDLVRGIVPPPFAQEVAGLDSLKSAMERLGGTLSTLQHLQRDGLERLVAVDTAFPNHHAEALVAATKVSVVADDTNAAEAVNTIVTDFIGVATPRPQAVTLAGAPRTSAAAFDAIRLHIVALSIAAWFLWSLLSVLTGAVLLVFQNPGFGTWLDYVICVGWGAGITLAGQQAGQMTPGGVAAAVGIRIPVPPAR